MVTLQETAAKFNNDLHVSHTGGRLSSDFGLVLIDEMMDVFQFTQLAEKNSYLSRRSKILDTYKS